MLRLPFSYLIYRLLMILISPAVLIWIWKTTETSMQRAARLGKVTRPINADIWLHCASVGEVNVVIPLIKVLMEKEKTAVITCFTVSGLAHAQRRLREIGAEQVACILLPIDWQWTTTRFLKQLTASELWLIETEFWPTLMINAKKQGIRIKLVNGRLSAKTLNAPRWWRNLLAYLLTYYVGTCLLRSEQDKRYYTELGVMPAQLRVTGNLKLCDITTSPLSRHCPMPYIVFASTHDPEEIQIAQLWQQHPTLPKLIIVPRHPSRGPQLTKQFLRLGVLHSLRSQHPESHKGIIIADTFGELLSWMAFSELVIMGGSFAPKGGQNPIEPARLGKFILTGPDMHDFADESASLMQVGALQVVPALNENLINEIKRLLKQSAVISQQGLAGQAWLLQTEQKVMTDTLSALFPAPFVATQSN